MLDSLPIQAPARTLISDVSGRAYPSGARPENDLWGLETPDEERVGASLAALARKGIDVVIAIGSGALPWTADGAGWPAAAEGRVPPLIRHPDGSGGEEGFPIAVAAAYEAGLDIDFAALFAGEMRHRVSLPPYPFERRRHWVDRAAKEPIRDNAWYGSR